MIFFSDLDRTLIYSNKFIDPNHNAVLVEKLDDKEISYMSQEAIGRLSELNKLVYFVPVTTRTIEQYKRISIFQHTIIPKYAIVSNGGNILVDGVIDKDWNELIKKSFTHDSLSTKEVLKGMEEIRGPWILSERMADNLFYYFIIDKANLPMEEVAAFSQWLSSNGWSLSIQGRKLYIVPNCVSKAKAAIYIKEKLGENITVASGDSLLDLCMLQVSDIAICPSHGEIVESHLEKALSLNNLTLTKNKGITASLEIIERAFEIFLSA